MSQNILHVENITISLAALVPSNNLSDGPFNAGEIVA